MQLSINKIAPVEIFDVINQNHLESNIQLIRGDISLSLLLFLFLKALHKGGFL